MNITQRLKIKHANIYKHYNSPNKSRLNIATNYWFIAVGFYIANNESTCKL